MIYKLESKKEFETVVKDLEETAKKYKFGVLKTHDVKETLTSKGLSFSMDCKIVEICNPQSAKQVLEVNPDISSALPCRVSVYRDKGNVTLATIKPTALLSMFPNPELKAVAEEVEAAILKIMKEAA